MIGWISFPVKYNIAPGNTVSLSKRSFFVNDISPMGNVVFNHRYVCSFRSGAVEHVDQTALFSLSELHFETVLEDLHFKDLEKLTSKICVIASK